MVNQYKILIFLEFYQYNLLLSNYILALDLTKRVRNVKQVNVAVNINQ